MHFKTAIRRIFFISASINAVKGRIKIDKGLIMHDPLIGFYCYENTTLILRFISKSNHS